MALPIEQVLQKQTDSLMSIPGVVGVAQGEKGGSPCIMLLVSKLSDELTAQIPNELDGYPVSLVETGNITAR